MAFFIIKKQTFACISIKIYTWTLEIRPWCYRYWQRFWVGFRSLLFCLMFCISLFVLLSFFCWPLYCLSFKLFLCMFLCQTACDSDILSDTVTSKHVNVICITPMLLLHKVPIQLRFSSLRHRWPYRLWIYCLDPLVS